MAYKIYCHTFPNGKKYIGQTKQTLEGRYRGGVGYANSTYVNYAFNKYGWDNVKHEILADNLSLEEANELEQYYIKYYDTCNHEKGYNLTLGGSGGQYFDYDKIVALWECGKGIQEIKEELGCSVSTVQRALEAANISGKERIAERAGKYHAKEVYSFTEDGQLIGRYPSLAEAGRATGVFHNNIVKVLQGERRLAGGMFWSEDPNAIVPRKKKHTNAKKIAQINEDGEVVEVYESMTDAAKAVGLKTYSAISQAIQREGRAGGYYW